MKNNVDYYRHEKNSHRHWKFAMLRDEYGWAGEGRFWALNNLIADADGCQLNVSTDSRLKVICAELNLKLDEFKLFLQFLITDAELLSCNDGQVTTRVLQECLQEVDKRRVYQRGKKKSADNDDALFAYNTQPGIETEKSITGEYDIAEDVACAVKENEETIIEKNKAVARSGTSMIEKPKSVIENNANAVYERKSMIENEQIKLNKRKLNEIKEKRESSVAPSSLAPPPVYSEEDRDGFRKFTDWIANKTPCVAMMPEPFTIEQYVALGTKHQLRPDEIKHLLTVMHNWPPLVKHNRSAYYTLLKWKKREGNR